MGKPIRGINVGKGQMDLRHLSHTIEFFPVEIYLKEDGSLSDKPSFAIVMQGTPSGKTIHVFGQLSLQEWNDALADVGYELIKKT